jgi:hypothetical protein
VDEIEGEGDGAIKKRNGVGKDTAETGGEVDCEEKDEGSEKGIGPSSFPCKKVRKAVERYERRSGQKRDLKR